MPQLFDRLLNRIGFIRIQKINNGSFWMINSDLSKAPDSVKKAILANTDAYLILNHSDAYALTNQAQFNASSYEKENHNPQSDGLDLEHCYHAFPDTYTYKESDRRISFSDFLNYWDWYTSICYKSDVNYSDMEKEFHRIALLKLAALMKAFCALSLTQPEQVVRWEYQPETYEEPLLQRFHQELAHRVGLLEKIGMTEPFFQSIDMGLSLDLTKLASEKVLHRFLPIHRLLEKRHFLYYQPTIHLAGAPFDIRCMKVVEHKMNDGFILLDELLEILMAYHPGDVFSIQELITHYRMPDLDPEQLEEEIWPW